jgi:hypothetical protein
MASLFDLITFRPKRAIGSFSGYVTIEEDHSDELTITKHPVERSPTISDHAIKEPAELSIRAGWSNSSLTALGGALLDTLNGNFGALLSPSYAEEIYQKLLALQATREPFDVFTGKRRYKNMLMRTLRTTTSVETENVLIVTATFQEIIIVQTQATTAPPASVQADPAKTSAVQSAGTKQLAPAPQANTDAIAKAMGG